MENVLATYERPYNLENPVVCFDERPCQLINDVLVPTPVQPGKPKREDYHYERNGTCVVLLAIEPLTGNRIVEVSEKKTKADYARFMKKVVETFTKAKKITLVQDNLNTHNPSSFYENMEPQGALELSEKLEMVYTPKKVSWLNIAEIEFSALSKQCLDRRIGDFDKMTKEVERWTSYRNKNKIKIDWQFTNKRLEISSLNSIWV
jgi:hypothetical protein